MANQPNVFNTLLNPLYVQTYERYLPTAFDEGMTLLEKTNKVIIYLNQIGKLTNDTLDQWNQVMDWVMADGLDASVSAKLDSMLADGTLATIITNGINSLGAEITALQTSDATQTSNIATNTANITQNTSDIATLKKNTGFIKYSGSPEDYGAIGDGTSHPLSSKYSTLASAQAVYPFASSLSDEIDWCAIQQSFNSNQITVLKDVSYVVNRTLTLPVNHSIDGNHGQLLVLNNWVSTNSGNTVPQNTILFVAGRQPTWLSELDSLTSFVRNVRIRGNASFNSLVGIYCGASDSSAITQSSVVNYAVYGRNFENVMIAYCANGLHLAEAWASQFTKVVTSHISQSALLLVGQVVNCTFVGCIFDTSGDGTNGAYIDAGVYSGVSHRPEGNSFIGGFIGQANSGIHFQSGLAFKFSQVIVDLNGNNAVVGSDMSDVTFTSCYLYGQGTVVIALADLSSNQNGSFVNFTDCNIVPSGTNNSASIGANQVGINFRGCQLTQSITFWSNARGSVKDCYWNQNDTTATMISINAGATVSKLNNTFKYTGTAVN